MTRTEKFDQRTMLSMPSVVRDRIKFTTSRAGAGRIAFLKKRREVEQDVPLDYGSTIDDYDDHIFRVTDQASCLSDVRGNDWALDQISDHLFKCVFEQPSPPEHDPLNANQRRRLEEELLGLTAEPRPVGRPRSIGRQRRKRAAL